MLDARHRTTGSNRCMTDEVKEIKGILEAAGIDNGYVRVERLNGTAPYFAYAVINDQSNSDGSFVPPVPASDAPTLWRNVQRTRSK